MWHDFGRVTLSNYFDTIFVGYYSTDDVIGAVIVMKSKLLCANCGNIDTQRKKQMTQTDKVEWVSSFLLKQFCLLALLFTVNSTWVTLRPCSLSYQKGSLPWCELGPLHGWNHPTVLKHWWQVRQSFLCIGKCWVHSLGTPTKKQISKAKMPPLRPPSRIKEQNPNKKINNGEKKEEKDKRVYVIR